MLAESDRGCRPPPVFVLAGAVAVGSGLLSIVLFRGVGAVAADDADMSTKEEGVLAG